MHKRMMHNETQKLETLREEDADDSLNISEVYDVRHNISLNTDSSIIADEDPLCSTEDEIARAEYKSETLPVLVEDYLNMEIISASETAPARVMRVLEHNQ